ncbi:hypothetical protein C8A01DRAFT_48202 [Parachaetomium inaequale]|uniref:Mei5 protein n=1 Tax=Parachaetomium inaequale TaxID=2588326 RepID=A0AAN6PDX2_9PEZI|nr:hypothetical protein C8A01DRAFT_48202 [Parachaetomium inaequale]
MALPNSSADLAEVENLLRALADKASVKRLAAVVEKNAKLEESNESLLNEKAVVLTLNQRLQNDIASRESQCKKKDDELQSVVQSKKALEAKLSAAEKHLEASVKKAQDLEVKFKRDVEETKSELKESNDELERLGEFFVELKPVNDRGDKIAATLSAVRTSAHSLAVTYFGVDLTPRVLANDDLWEKIGEHNSNGGNLPIPSSNSPLAKQMRVALIFSVLAHELCEHIFQPSYLLKESSGLKKLLTDLAAREPDLESHLRSMLLMASDKINGPVDAKKGACVKAVFDTISGLLSPAIPDSKQGFETDLQNLCVAAFEGWQPIQSLEDHITPELGSKLSKRKYSWKPLAFTLPSPSQPAAAPKQRANGSAPAQGPLKNSLPAATQSRVDETADLADGVAVWPAFVNLSSDAKETLVEGLILPLCLIKAAEEEQMAMPASPTSSHLSHRELRANERNSSMKRRRPSIAATNGHATEGGRKGSFLSNGHGGGPKGT